MQSFPVTLQQGMKKLHGHWYLAPGKLYFVCTNSNSAWGQAIGQGVGGIVGGFIGSISDKTPGQSIGDLDESGLQAAVLSMPGSMVMAAEKIEVIKVTIWWRLIKYDGQRFGFPKGLSKDLRSALTQWGQQNSVQTKL
jgi:hypothetical protein